MVKNIFYLLLFTTLTVFGQNSLTPEDKIYNAVDAYSSNPTVEGLQNLSKADKDFWKNKKHLSEKLWYGETGISILDNEIKKLLRPLSDINIHERLAHEQKKLSYAIILSDELNDLFSYYPVDSLYIIAGRSATVSYSELFEKYLFAYVQSRLEKNRNIASQFKLQTVDEILMLKFIEKITDNKNKNNEAYLSGWDSVYKKYKIRDIEGDEQINRNLVKDKTFEILKGEYTNDNSEERIVLKTQESINLRNASSGQQEVIRILQDIFLVIFKQLKVLRIVEEPEAHLFPVAQKNLIELLALMVNQNDDNQLIITTHSPYILSVFNNLLFAQRVVDKNPSAEAEVAELIPKEFWLKAKDFSAYSLGNSFIKEEHEYCESIFNQQTGAIKQNYLDEVSEMLGGDFNTLYSIYTKSSGRR